MNNSKRNKLLKAINDIQNNFTSHVSSSSSSSASSSVYVSSTNPELAQHFTFPVDRIHAILSKEIFFQKLDLFITIYLVNILEYICKDILRLTLYYVRMLGKYNTPTNPTHQATKLISDRPISNSTTSMMMSKMSSCLAIIANS